MIRKKMKTYKIPCSWEMYGYMDIEAETLEEAVHAAEHFLTPLPEGHYVDESFEVDTEVLYFEFQKEQDEKDA